MQIILDPMLGSKIEYLWFAHRRPWVISVGKINRARIEDELIQVSFTMSLKDAQKSPRWDEVNKRLLAEIVDADGRVVIDNWVEFGENKKVITATMCIGDPNV